MTEIIAIAGAQGTGKTYLARGVTNSLNRSGKRADYVSEVAREWIGRFGSPKDVADQLDLFEMQLQKEDAALTNTSLEYLVVDSPIYLPYLYGVMVSNIKESKEQFRLQRLFSRVLKYSDRYSCNIILSESMHKGDDSLRVWDQKVEKIISTGLYFYLNGVGLNNIHEIRPGLNFEERVLDVCNFINQVKGGLDGNLGLQY